MRFSNLLMIAAVALVSCGGGGSSSSSAQAVPAAPTLTSPVSPASGTWSASLGPWSAQTSGKLNAFAVDPHDASTMYVGGGIGTVDGVTSDTGVYKTSNGGSSWSMANAGLTDTTINWLTFDGNGALYAATESGGIFRSTDGAASWHNVSGEAGVRQIVSANGMLYAASRAGVLASLDGQSWMLVAATPSAANSIAVSGGALFVGLVDGSFARASAHGNMSVLHVFSALGAPPVVHDVAVDPNDAQSIYVSLAAMLDGIYTDALMHSTNGGATWTQVAIPASLRGAQAIAFSRTIAHRLFVAGVGLAYTDDGVRLVTSNGFGDARTLTVLNGDRLAIGSDQGMALGSYGAGFHAITGGLPVNIVRSVAFSGSTVLVTMQDFAPAVSFDSGSTWQTLSVNSTENGVAYINPGAANICYVLDNGINVSSDGCHTFVNQPIGSRLASTEPFATVPNSAKTYAVTSNGLYVANDGLTFLPIACAVPGPVDVAVDPRNANHVFISSATGGAAVWHSTDGGATFSRSALLLPPGPSYPNDAPVLAVDPNNGDVIAVTETAVYRSTDGGETFSALHQLAAASRAHELAAQAAHRDPDARAQASAQTGFNIDEHVEYVPSPAGPMLTITTTAGIASSLDDGTTMQALDKDAVSHQFEGFAADGTGRFCVGTDGQGVICSTLTKLSS